MKSFGKRASITFFAVTGIAFTLGTGSALAGPGDPDPAFGDRGVVSVPLAAGESQSSRVIERQPDGRLLVVGVDTGTGDSLLSRFLSDGSPDPEFGQNGVVRVPGDGWDAVTVGADGSIVATGSAGNLAVVAAFGSDGSLNPAFGDQGLRTFDVTALRPAEYAESPVEIALRSVRILGDGSIRSIGTFFDCKGDYYENACPNLMEIGLKADGTADTGFTEGDGSLVLPQGGDDASALIRPDGGAYIVRDTSTEAAVGLDFIFTATRIDAAGVPVPGYGGRYDTGRSSLGPTPGVITLDSKNRLYVVAGPDIVRFKEDGGFGAYLRPMLTRYVRGIRTAIGGITVDERDRITVSGGIVQRFGDSKRQGGFIARMTDTGRPDPTLGSDGVGIAWFGPASTGGQALSGAGLARDGDSKIVIAGQTKVGDSIAIRLARFDAGTSKRYLCDGKPADYIGTPGKDVIRLGFGSIVTLGGDDRVVPVNNGPICLGTGDDRLDASRYYAEPRVWGGAGDDRIEGATESNTIHGGPGDDRITGGDKDDRLSGGPGDDRVSGGKWDDRIDGGPGRDRLEGQTGRDQLVGGPDRDVLRPGPLGPLVRRYSGRAGHVRTEVVVEGNEARFDLSLTLKCSSRDEKTRRTTAGANVELKGDSGSFRQIAPPNQRDDSAGAYFTDIVGKFSNGGVSGRVGTVDSDHWSDNYTCHSGKSLKNLWVPFKADLLPQRKQFAHQ